MENEFTPNDHLWLRLALRWQTEAAEISEEIVALQVELAMLNDLVKLALAQIDGLPPD